MNYYLTSTRKYTMRHRWPGAIEYPHLANLHEHNFTIGVTIVTDRSRAVALEAVGEALDDWFTDLCSRNLLDSDMSCEDYIDDIHQYFFDNTDYIIHAIEVCETPDVSVIAMY